MRSARTSRMRALVWLRVGDDAGLRAGQADRPLAEVVDRHRAQGARDALAGREQHVHLARVGRGGHLLGHRDQLVGGLPARREHRDDAMPLFAGGHDPPRRALDPLGVGDGGASELHHDGAGHPGQSRSCRIRSAERACNSRPTRGLSVHLDDWTIFWRAGCDAPCVAHGYGPQEAVGGFDLSARVGGTGRPVWPSRSARLAAPASRRPSSRAAPIAVTHRAGRSAAAPYFGATLTPSRRRLAHARTQRPPAPRPGGSGGAARRPTSSGGCDFQTRNTNYA